MAIRSPVAVAVFLVVAAASLAADLLSKHYVFESLVSDPALEEQIQQVRARRGTDLSPEEVLHNPDIRPYLQRKVFPGVRFTLSMNPVVVFGLRMPRPLVAVATVVAFALVLLLFATADSKSHSVHLGLGFILAGALGNLYDRLASEVVLPGVDPIRHQVRDFIDCSRLYYPWVFNVADVLLVVGVALLLLHWWNTRRRGASKSPSRPGSGR
jgi:signal peptidase II